MGKLGDAGRKKTDRERESQYRDWREPLLRSPFFQIHHVVPFWLVSFVSICYIIFAFLVLRHKLSRFEVHLIFLSLALSLIYTGFLNIVQKEAWGKRGVVHGTAAVWGGIIVMIMGILALIFYLAVTVGLI